MEKRREDEKLQTTRNFDKKSIFHITAEELKELDREYDVKLLKLLGYLRKRNYKKIQKEKHGLYK